MLESVRTRRRLNRGRRSRLMAATVVMTVVGLFTFALPAEALPGLVLNPGPFTLTVTDGYLNIGALEFDLTPSEFPECSDGEDNESDWLWFNDGLIDYPTDPECSEGADNSELRDGYQPQLPTEIGGVIDKDGNVMVPQEGVNFPPAYMYEEGNMVVQIEATDDGTGFLNPATGDTEVTLPMSAAISGSMGLIPIPEGCAIGTAENPIVLDMTDSVPYNQQTGTVTLLDDTFAVPAATGCGWIVGPLINTLLGLPSAPGNNAIEITVVSDPIIRSSYQWLAIRIP